MHQRVVGIEQKQNQEEEQTICLVFESTAIDKRSAQVNTLLMVDTKDSDTVFSSVT